MIYFGLDSESVIARIRNSRAPVRMASLGQSLATGCFGFGAVSVAAFAVWAWGGTWLGARVGELGLYGACGVVLIGGGGLVLSPLLVGPGARGRFCGLFALAFFLYAGVWTGSYFSLRSRSGEVLAALLGPAILGMTLANAFATPGAMRRIVAALCATHAAGYFAGEILYESLDGKAGMLLWGLTYGIGFGAGIGFTLFTCQEPVRSQLAELENKNPDAAWIGNDPG